MEISWSSFHRFNRENVSKYSVASSGVYILWKKVGRFEWECFYSAQTQNLTQTLLDHLLPTEPNTMLRETIEKSICGFQFASVSSQPNRDAIEQFLFDRYQPACNVHDPGGIPVHVNLPRTPRY